MVSRITLRHGASLLRVGPRRYFCPRKLASYSQAAEFRLTGEHTMSGPSASKLLVVGIAAALVFAPKQRSLRQSTRTATWIPGLDRRCGFVMTRPRTRSPTVSNRPILPVAAAPFVTAHLPTFQSMAGSRPSQSELLTYSSVARTRTCGNASPPPVRRPVE